MTVQEQQQIRIRELEKEIARLHAQIKEQRYGLTWLDVPEAFEADSENKIPILEEVKEKAIDAPCRDAARHFSTEKSAPHIIIEGDNYHALTCLNYTHRGKIDVIYIDPPYNTGSDGFTYKDKRILTQFPDGSLVPKDHPLRHSYWLSFMSKRLELAKNLLSEKGVIFISIDDNEQANLKLLCDKVFGEENFVAIFIWKSRQNKDNRNVTGVSIDHEYVICYCKKYGERVIKGGDRKIEQYSNPDNDPRGPWTSANMVGLLDETKRPNCHYELINPDTGTNYGKPKMGWRYDKKTMTRLINEKRIIWPETPQGRPRKKSFLSEISNVKPGFSSFIGEQVFTRNGTKQINNIFDERLFGFPKPTEIIEELLEQSSNHTSTILDFFAGSGTTLHATMKLNAEDGGNRQCILVQQQEGDNNICENVTYERNRRVMCGYTNAKGEQVEGLGGRLKYYRTAFVGKNASRTATDADRVELSLKAGYLLALGENTLEEISHTESYQIFADGENPQKYTAIFFTENYAKLPDFVAEIEQLRANAATPVEFAVYIFCWGQPDVFEGEFNNLRGISLKAIPQPILDVYKSINQ